MSFRLLPLSTRPLLKPLLAMVQSLWILAIAASAQAATFVVTNTSDAGPGSLLEALTDASLNPGMDMITFSNVSGQITLFSSPTIEDTMIIGPGARQLTLITSGIVINSGRSNTISGVRITP